MQVRQQAFASRGSEFLRQGSNSATTRTLPAAFLPVAIKSERFNYETLPAEVGKLCFDLMGSEDSKEANQQKRAEDPQFWA